MKKYKVLGMDCASCASLIQMDLEDAGYKCKCSYNSESLEVEGEHDVRTIEEIVIKTGYTLEIENE